ncbi:MAG: hypothetical protein KA818_11680 [Methanoculleus sp.]|jgi:hypothetical protein|nr:hypothetical protein [Methanoculleus sp.]
MHRIIDWKAIYVSSPERVEKGRDPAAVWDRRAAAYRQATRGEKRATEQELAVLDLATGDTVSDVGAGTGCRAVAIACTAANVTARPLWRHARCPPGAEGRRRAHELLYRF